MKIAICDDESADLGLIQNYCRQYDPGIETAVFTSGEALLSAYKKEYYDLVFLDIEMEPLNGLELGAELMSCPQKPVIIFTTHSLNYALRGYGIALRYLPKPITYPVFQKAMEAALDIILPQKIWIRTNDAQLHISIREILYFEVLQHRVTVHLNCGDVIIMRGSLAEIIAHVPHRSFVQAHKSYFINMEYIDHVTGLDIVMTNGDIIPIARSRKDQFLRCLSKFMKGSHLNEALD